jgi:tetratricopeptide (TPR) repeat protein
MVVDENDIRQYLERIREAGVLGRGVRRDALLEYLLRAELNDDGAKIKAYSIGVDIFEKPKDFDPATDSSVRVEVGRLRTAIALFEAGALADTAIKVDIPVGTYRPEITRRDADAQSPQSPEVETVRSDETRGPWRPFRWFGALVTAITVVAAALLGVVFLSWPSPEPTVPGPPISLTVDDFSGELLGKELSILVKDSFSNNRVVAIKSSDFGKLGDEHFIVRGKVTDFDQYLWVGVELAHLSSNEIVWNHVFELDRTGDLKAEVDTKLNGELETRLIGAAKTLLEKRDVKDLSPQQLFILGTWVSGPAESSLEWETERVTLMKLALDKDPDFGPAHSVLADKYGFLANMHPEWDTEESLRLSRFHAERAIELSPLDANAMFNVAQSYWHAGRHKESQRVFRRVNELDSGNSLARFFAKVVPFWCADVPDDVMQWAIDFDKSLSRDDPIRWIVLTWIATLHTNRGEYNLALQDATDAARIFQVGYTYMLHAMLLNKVGQPNAAQASVEWQYTNWPGISTSQYVGSTVPRLCLEQPNPDRFVNDYRELARAFE